MDHSKFYENVYRQKNPVDFLDGRLVSNFPRYQMQ